MEESIVCWSVCNNITGKEYRIMARSKWQAIAEAVRLEDFQHTAAVYSAKRLQ
jgi:hypothetical protein